MVVNNSFMPTEKVIDHILDLVRYATVNAMATYREEGMICNAA
jgi:hypothetical protein